MKCRTCGQWAIIGNECNICASGRLLDQRKREREDAAAGFGADDHDRAREYDKLNGPPGLRDCDVRAT